MEHLDVSRNATRGENDEEIGAEGVGAAKLVDDVRQNVDTCRSSRAAKIQAVIRAPLFSETARQESNVERFISNTVCGDLSRRRVGGMDVCS